MRARGGASRATTCCEATSTIRATPSPLTIAASRPWGESASASPPRREKVAQRLNRPGGGGRAARENKLRGSGLQLKGSAVGTRRRRRDGRRGRRHPDVAADVRARRRRRGVPPDGGVGCCAPVAPRPASPAAGRANRRRRRPLGRGAAAGAAVALQPHRRRSRAARISEPRRPASGGHREPRPRPPPIRIAPPSRGNNRKVGSPPARVASDVAESARSSSAGASSGRPLRSRTSAGARRGRRSAR